MRDVLATLVLIGGSPIIAVAYVVRVLVYLGRVGFALADRTLIETIRDWAAD